MIAKRLKLLRDKNSLSLQDVANVVEISKPHLWQLEQGISDNPSIKTLQRLAIFYNTTVSYIIGEK